MKRGKKMADVAGIDHPIWSSANGRLA